MGAIPKWRDVTALGGTHGALRTVNVCQYIVTPPALLTAHPKR